MPVTDAISLVIIVSILSVVQVGVILRFLLRAPNFDQFLVPTILVIGVGFAVLDWVNVVFLKMIVVGLEVRFGRISPSGDPSQDCAGAICSAISKPALPARSGGGRQAGCRPANNVIHPARLAR